MSALKKQNEKDIYLDNPSWKKESLLNGMVVLHTIQSKKASQQIIQKLQESDYTLEDRQKKREILLSSKNTLSTTELQEVHIDKLKITEGSIVSVIKPNERRTYSINENEPSGSTNNGMELAQTNDQFRAIEHERFVFKQEVTREKNSYFFRAKDAENLYVLGDNFYKDFKNGYKHFSFAHLGGGDAQKKSILGVASFMYYFENLKILIVTNSMDNSVFNVFKNDNSKTKACISDYPAFEYEVFHHEGLNYLETGEIIENSKKHQVKGIEYLVKKIADDYDVVFYDLPEIAETKTHYMIYFPILQMVENVTFTVNVKKNTYLEIDELRKYFSNYKIHLKGLIVESQHEDEK